MVKIIRMKKRHELLKYKNKQSSTTMKINFSNFWKKAILKKMQLIYFLKRGERLINWLYRRKIDWIKMLQFLLI